MCIKHPSVGVHMARSSILTIRTHISHIRRRDVGPAASRILEAMFIGQTKKINCLMKTLVSAAFMFIFWLRVSQLFFHLVNIVICF